jgi:CRISPR-associated endoribonuclease Cas2 subtype I-E
MGPLIRRPDNRLCLGGARALEPGAAVGSTDDRTLSAVVGAYLRRFLRASFPRLGEIQIEAEWTGVLGFTHDKRPLVGAVRERVWAVLADWFPAEPTGSLVMTWPDKALPGGQAVMVLGAPPVQLHDHDGLILVRRAP